jgi:hypothetical protein
MALIARNGLWLTRKGFASDPFSFTTGGVAGRLEYDGLVQAIASGEMRLASASNMQVYSANSNVLLGAGGMSNVISVRSNLVEINANVHIRGAVESYMSTEINLQDKVMRLAFPDVGSEATINDAYLDGSGISLADELVGNYEKSIKWHSAAGIGASAFVAKGGTSNESFWELRGGGMRLTTPKRAAGRGNGEVSYGMHINEREELEMYKRWTDGSGHEFFQRVFTFGSAMPADMPTPMSPNPFFNGSSSSSFDFSSAVATTSNVTASNVTASNVTASNVTTSNVTTSNVTTSNVTTSNVTTSNVTASNVTASNVTASNVTTSNVTTSNVTTSNVTSVSSNNTVFVPPWYDYRFAYYGP